MIDQPPSILLDGVQRKVVFIGRTVFGRASMGDTKERLLRFSEESAETQQACGLTFEEYVEMGRHVWGQKPGEIFQEIGGVGVTLLSLADVHGLDAIQMINRESDRVWNNQDAIRAKAAKKPDAIFSTRPIK